MRLFINNKRIYFIEKNQPVQEESYTKILNGENGEVDVRLLKGNLLVKDASPELLKQLLTLLDSRKLPELVSISFTVNDKESTKQLVKNEFRIIKAAGGLVVKDDKVLLIYRLGYWDLPKGKLEKDEAARPAAVREVEEECGVNAEIVDKICSTWHSYNSKGKRILKKTKWYLMHCIDDSRMGPQVEENIEKVEWKTMEEASLLLENSYSSIGEVMREFLAMPPRPSIPVR